jgi:MoaA/NifB/PqqE/SkfB family radical SAM enzyme
LIQIKSRASVSGHWSAMDRAEVEDLPQPEPVTGLADYRGERARRLALDRRCAANYARYQRAARHGASVDYLPIKLDIENVSRCNFACIMCPVSEWPKGRRAADLPLEAFQRLIDEQFGLVEVKIQGLGEPTLQRDAFFAMIRYARERAIWVRTVTNASLLHLHDNYRKLIDSGVNEVQISIDGADKAVFESIRRQSVFERVTANCRLINAYCAARGVVRTKMWTVVQQANRHQLPALVELAAGLGFRHLVFSLSLTDFGTTQWRERNDAVAVTDTISAREARELVAQAAARGVRLAFWTVRQKYRAGPPDALCPWPFERAVVSSDLRVVPCCFIGSPDVSELGSASPSFSDVWFGPAMRAFRQAHLSGAVPAICAGCYQPTPPG